MRSMLKKVLAVSMLAATAATGNALAAAYSSLVVFGDSLADNGNNALAIDAGYWAPLAQPGDRTPTPIPDNSFVPTAPYASDRYSNGPVWTDQFAGALGMSLLPSLAGGNNYAFGGALSGMTGDVPGLLAQTNMYLGNTGGVAQSDALYVVQGGGNDVRAALATQDAGKIQQAITNYAGNIESVVSLLTGAGARNILVVDVPDIGEVPSIKGLGAQIAAQATGISAAMNAALSAELAALSLPTGTDLDVLDLFGLLDSLIANPAAFGFTDATNACAATLACIANPAGTFFWDGLHATTAGAGIIANYALLAVGAVPEPSPVALFAAIVLAGMLLRRHSGSSCTSLLHSGPCTPGGAARARLATPFNRC